MSSPPIFLDLVRRACREQRLSPRTEQAYLDWSYRYFVFHGKRAPEELAEPEVGAFLSYLATERRVAPSTQNQALCALLFLYRQVLQRPLTNITRTRVRRYELPPSVLLPEEVQTLLTAMQGVPRLVASLLYGTGMRLEEVLNLRLYDVDINRYSLLVRATKAHPARTVPLPAALIDPVLHQFGMVTSQHVRDCIRGHGFVDCPNMGSYPAELTRDSNWQYLFPARRPLAHVHSRQLVRGRLHECVIQRALKDAAKRTNLEGKVSCHSLRHCYASHQLATGCDITTLQQLLGHNDVRSTLRYKATLPPTPRIARFAVSNL